jgi:hypothetical protein
LTINTDEAVLFGLAAIVVSILFIIFIGKRKDSGYKSNAVDRDGDGIVQEGTKWERPAGTVRLVPKKKTPAKKTSTATAAKKAPAKKAAPKKK